MTDKTKTAPSEVFEQTLKNYEQTLRAGLKMQEQAGQWWTNLLNQTASTQDFQKRVKAMTKDIIPPVQKRMEEYLNLLEKNTRANVDLLKKAVEGPQPTSPSDYQAKVVDFCETSLNLCKSNIEAVAGIQNKMIEAWFGFVKKNRPDFAEAIPSKA